MENSVSLELSSRILVVDDEKIVRETIDAILKRYTDYEVDFAENGMDALEKWKTAKSANLSYDLFIIDLRMPKMDGTSLIKEIHQSEPDLAFIVLTGHGSFDEASSLLKNFHITDFIKKPLKNSQQLIFSVENALEKRRLRWQLMQKNRELEQTNQELRHTQNRLAKVLDIVEEAIITVDARRQINFLNQRAELILGYTTQEILGQPLNILMSPDSIPDSWNTAAIIETESVRPLRASVQIQIQPKNQEQRLMRASLFYFKLEDETVLVLILHESPSSHSSTPEKRTSSLTSNIELMDQLQQERQRIQVLGEAFEGTLKLLFQGGQALVQELKSVDQVLNEMSDYLDEEYQTEELHELLVQVMSLSLQYWETTTGKTKFELAEVSSIWKVYLDKSTYRTKTLDRYLQIETLPQVPRWKDVLATAQYVLTHCPSAPSLQSELESAVLKLQNLLRTAYFKNGISPLNPSKN